VTASLEEISQLLRTHGLRPTAGRVAVYRTVATSPAHPSADLVAGEVRGMLGTLSTQAVYDALHVLTAAGLLRRIEPAGSPARYEARVGDNHHHVVCRRCGATADIECAVGTAPCLDPGDSHGFLVDEAEVTFWGLCPSCRELAAAA
jgi:Fur family ferric uptake transcriptional regulator